MDAHNKQIHKVESLRTEIYQAPSWSWASKPGGIIATDRSAASPVGSQCLGYDYSEKVKEVAKVRDVEEVTREGNPMSPATFWPPRLTLKCTSNVKERNFMMKGVQMKLILDISGDILVGRSFCMLLRSTGREKGQYEHVGYVATAWSMSNSVEPVPVITTIKRVQAERVIMTDEFYEGYNQETDEYIFTII
ncbi:hypothetical protein B0J14DRAFT_560469 [Halenospora varia]|nr:hypothetical protein B0J14DRAFT_560469 [Halenospora varia]